MCSQRRCFPASGLARGVETTSNNKQAATAVSSAKPVSLREQRQESMLFISHSSKDKAEAEKLYALLVDRGYDPGQIFLDSDDQSGIEAGAKWEQALYERLKSCLALVVLCSPHWKASQWCFAELIYARMSGKQIFPVVIAGDDFGSLLGDHQAVFVARDGNRAYEQLLAALAARHLSPKDHLPWPHPDLKDAHGSSDDCPFPGLLAFDEDSAPGGAASIPHPTSLLPGV